VKITFAGHVSAFGWQPDGEPKLNVTARTRGGASIYSWTFDISVRCADNNRPLPSLGQTVPNDIAANLFNSVGAVEISEYREPNSPILTARQCRHVMPVYTYITFGTGYGMSLRSGDSRPMLHAINPESTSHTCCQPMKWGPIHDRSFCTAVPASSSF
jgi:hypothetical protein